MPLVIEHVDTKKKYSTPSKEAHDPDTRVRRRVYCTGCGTGNSYSPEQWVYSPEQVQAWFEEHKTHGSAEEPQK